MKKINNKGFTLLEIVIALGVLVMMAGFVITSLSAIPQARMRETAQTVKTEFELARNFAKTHGGEAVFSLCKLPDGGISITRTSDVGKTKETIINDKELEVFYKSSGDDAEYNLGKQDATNVDDATLKMRFAQTSGEVIGPNKIDYLILSNGHKLYKFVFQNNSGMIYYDYEIEEEWLDWDTENDGFKAIELPIFVTGQTFASTVDVLWTGTSVQPEIKYDARNIKISGVYRAKDPGRYEIIFKLKDPYKTAWEGGDKEDYVLEWTITKK